MQTKGRCLLRCRPWRAVTRNGITPQRNHNPLSKSQKSFEATRENQSVRAWKTIPSTIQQQLWHIQDLAPFSATKQSVFLALVCAASKRLGELCTKETNLAWVKAGKKACDCIWRKFRRNSFLVATHESREKHREMILQHVRAFVQRVTL